MKWALAFLLVVHGAIHLLGPVKAFGIAPLPALTSPVSRAMGWVWLAAAVACLASAAALVLAPRHWWMLGALALFLSQVAIVSAWPDARFGTMANAVLLVAATYGFASLGPFSQRATYERTLSAELDRAQQTSLLRDDDLRALPPLVQEHVRRSGAVGQPRPYNVRVHFAGDLRQGATSPWMPTTVEQVNHFDRPSRVFFLTATRMGIPFEAYHRYIGSEAGMRVKVAALFTVADAHGPQMTAAETVTLLNDMCLLAPGSLVDPNISWETIDDHTVRATFTNAGHRVTGTLVFNAAGELENFWSDDRWALSSDGRTFTRQRWSTPVRGYQQYGAHRLARFGEVRYQAIDGSDSGYVYARFDLKDVAYNITKR